MALFAGNVDDLKSLYTSEIRSLLSTEEQITKALPKMVDAATDHELKRSLQTHLDETKQHVQRLKDILLDMRGDDEEKKCSVTAELINAAESTIKAAKNNAVRDVGIIASAQKIEHFEMASYGAVRNWARLLGLTKHEQLLQQILKEEENADRALTGVSDQRNPEAVRAA